MSALGQKRTFWKFWAIRFIPKSGHWLNGSGCPLCAKSGPMHRNKELSLFEARSCVDELSHPSKLPYDWKPMQGPPGAADCGKHRQAAGSRNSNRLSVIVPMMMPAVALEVVVDPACAVTDRRPPERLTKNPADHPAGNCPNRTGNYKS
jgi:hypothetical protein